MTDQSEQTAETTTIIDVELEDEQRQKTEKILRTNYIFIPPNYRARMAQTGLLNRFAQSIELETARHQFIKQLLNKYYICIPIEFYSHLFQNNLLDSMINLAQDVDREKEELQINFRESMKRYGPQGQNNDDNERQVKKRKTSDSNDSVSTYTNIDCSSTTTTTTTTTTSPDGDEQEHSNEESSQ